MKIFFDTEFIEDGKTIDLISIGLVREDGEELYLENIECDLSRANEFVREQVIPHIGRGDPAVTREYIRDAILRFAGDDPEFWAWFGSYDWVVLCQLFGRMVDLPRHWPMRVRELAQYSEHTGCTSLPAQTGTKHNALEDAKWVKEAWEHIRNKVADQAIARTFT